MLSFPPAVRIRLALAPADLRKGFDALAELVREHQEFHGVHKGLLIQSLQRSLQDARGIGARRSGCDRHGSVPEPLR